MIPRPMRQKFPKYNYQTPPHAIAPLIPYLRRDWLIWECACGKGNIVRYLQQHGFQVIGTDIIYGQDFFQYESERFDCIVTNPPYTMLYEFISRCYELGKPWAMLMPLTTLEGRRQLLFKKYGIELLLLDKRIHFETLDLARSNSWFPVAWFCWKILPREIVFGHVEKEI